MNGLSFTIDPSPALPDKPLGDPSVGLEIVGAKAAYNGQQKLGGVSFGFGVEARAGISAFNSKDDKDPDGVLSLPVERDSSFKVEIPPQIQLTEKDAWLKYRCSAALKGSASGAAAPVAFKLDASKEVIFTDFHVHSRDEKVCEAVLADLAQLRFAANVDDVFKLGDKEALSYQVKGRLFAGVTLSWSDVFTACLGTLSQFLKSGTLLTLEIKPAASVTFHVALDDDFRVVFTRGGGENVIVALKRADSREVGVSAAIGVSVGFADPGAVKAALDKVLQALVGKPVAVIDDILGKATLGNLTEAERIVVGELIRRLGFEELAHSLQDLKDKWDALKKRVEDTIEQVAKAKIALGFTYDYLRVHAEESLLVAELDRETFARFHNELMLCNFQGLLQWVGNNPDALRQYLNQTKLTRKQAWGFSLGIGPWSIGGKDQKNLTSIVQRNLQGDERIAYLGLRGYVGRGITAKDEWTVDFKAQMESFTKAGTATLGHFKYGLHFKMTWEQNNLEMNELRKFLDLAVIWRVITQDNAEEILEKMRSNPDKTATLTLEITLDDDVFRSILPLAASAVEGDLPFRALAKAMPFLEEFEGRRSPSLREAIYAPLWKYFFQNASRPITIFPDVAAQDVENITRLGHIADGRGLAEKERGTGTTLRAYQDFPTFSGQLHYHGQSHIKDNWLDFSQGLKDLNSGLTPGSLTPHKQIVKIFGLLASFWGQSLYVRAAGVFLVDLAATDQRLLAGVNRAFTIALKEGDVITFGASV